MRKTPRTNDRGKWKRGVAKTRRKMEGWGKKIVNYTRDGRQRLFDEPTRETARSRIMIVSIGVQHARVLVSILDDSERCN